MILEYSKYKEEVIRDCEMYFHRRGKMEDGVTENRLRERVQQLKEGKFLLAIVGEVKAGKSTLINAILGKSFLPSDVLQNTSALIEIVKGEKERVSITFVNGEKIDKDSDIAAVLREFAAIKDEFRQIPTGKWNDLFIANNGEITSKILEKNLGYLFDSNNTQRLGKEDFYKLSRRYVEEITLSKRVPVKIELFFPFSYEFSHLRIIDSPGVNAIGEIQEITKSFIRKAHALLFVHSFEEAVEKSSFKDFVESCVPEVMKECLFLVFSKTWGKGKNELIAKLSEATKLYSSMIDERRILNVDSLLRIIFNELQEKNSAEELHDFYKKEITILERDNKKMSELILFEKKQDIIENLRHKYPDCHSKNEWLNLLDNLSNFQSLLESIGKFSLRAPILQLAEIYESLSNGYHEQIKHLEEKRHLLGTKCKDRRILEKEINDRKDALDNLERNFNEFAEKILNKFSGRSDFENLISEKKTQYQEKIKCSETFPKIENFLESVLSEIRMIVDKAQRKLIEECNNFLVEYKQQITLEQFSFPGIDFQTIKDELKDKAITDIPYHVQECGTDHERIKKGYSEKLHFNLVRDHILNEIEKHSNSAIQTLEKICQSALSNFRHSICQIKEFKKNEYNCLLEEKNEDDFCRNEINEINSKINEINLDYERIKSLAFNWRKA